MAADPHAIALANHLAHRIDNSAHATIKQLTIWGDRHNTRVHIVVPLGNLGTETARDIQFKLHPAIRVRGIGANLLDRFIFVQPLVSAKEGLTGVVENDVYADRVNFGLFVDLTDEGFLAPFQVVLPGSIQLKLDHGPHFLFQEYLRLAVNESAQDQERHRKTAP